MPGHGMIHFILQLLCKSMRFLFFLLSYSRFHFLALPLFGKPFVQQLVNVVRYWQRRFGFCRCSANLLCGTVCIRKCNMLRCLFCSLLLFSSYCRFGVAVVRQAFCYMFAFECTILLQLFCKSTFSFSLQEYIDSPSPLRPCHWQRVEPAKRMDIP